MPKKRKAKAERRREKKRRLHANKGEAEGSAPSTERLTEEQHDAANRPAGKKRKLDQSSAAVEASSAVATEAAAAQSVETNTLVFPFPTDADDHCESPLEAYQDIVALLQCLEKQQGRKLSIYDPYYCDGAVVRNLTELGFPDVYNKKEDCYHVWLDPSAYPSFDVLVTNPPYSEDHIEKLMKHVTSNQFGFRPWLLLMPNWVIKKEYYAAAVAQIRPFYIVPNKRYVYLPPKDFRSSKKSDTHKKSSPFVSMWYIWGGSAATNEALIQAFQQSNASQRCQLARSKNAVRDLRRKKK